jgi:beta-glucosidase
VMTDTCCSECQAGALMVLPLLPRDIGAAVGPCSYSAAAALIIIACSTTAAAAAPPPSSWHDTSLSPARRAQMLISSLTLEEKVSLLQVSQPEIARVGVPAYNFGRECERGDSSGKLGTAYPTGLALGGTFDVQLVHAIAAATAVEVRGNVNTDVASDNTTFGASCFGPVSNLVRDPRYRNTLKP